MATLNRFRQYIDPDTKDGLLLIKAATIDFKSPVEKLFTLSPDGLEAERFISAIKETSRTFGYDYLVKNVPGLRVETVETADDGTDTTVISYEKHVNMLTAFSPDNIETAWKAASLTYGDKSFEIMENQELRESLKEMN